MFLCDVDVSQSTKPGDQEVMQYLSLFMEGRISSWSHIVGNCIWQMCQITINALKLTKTIGKSSFPGTRGDRSHMKVLV